MCDCLRNVADGLILMIFWLFFLLSSSESSLELTNQVCGISQGAFSWENFKVDAPYTLSRCAEICKASGKPNIAATIFSNGKTCGCFSKCECFWYERPTKTLLFDDALSRPGFCSSSTKLNRCKSQTLQDYSFAEKTICEAGIAENIDYDNKECIENETTETKTILANGDCVSFLPKHHGVRSYFQAKCNARNLILTACDPTNSASFESNDIRQRVDGGSSDNSNTKQLKTLSSKIFTLAIIYLLLFFIFCIFGCLAVYYIKKTQEKQKNYSNLMNRGFI